MNRIKQAGEWAIVVGVFIIYGGLLAGMAGELPLAAALGVTGHLWVVAGLLGVHQ